MRRAAAFALALSLATLNAAAAEVPQVTVRIAFDPAAAEALQKRGERVVVAGYFYGEPRPGATEAPDEMGFIDLANEAYTIRARDAVLVLGGSLSNAPLDQVIAPKINVNVYSARFTDENNLLDCGIVDDDIAALKGPQDIFCKLLP